MHPIESQLIKLIESGQVWQLSELGGIDRVTREAQNLGITRVLPELLSPLIQEWKAAPSQQSPVYRAALLSLLEVASIDFVLMEAVDILDFHRPLPDDTDDEVFGLLLKKALVQGSAAPSALSRSAALDGAFRFTDGKRSRQLRLVIALLELSAQDAPDFLRHAAKIAGVAFTHWREKDLVEVLNKLAQSDAIGVQEEASFELGMATLAEAMDQAVREQAIASFRAAREWFAKANLASFEGRGDARLYLGTLDTVLAFHDGAPPASLKRMSEEIALHAFDLHSRGNENLLPWLGSRHTEAVNWSLLAGTMAELTANLSEPSWWDPSAVIEQSILSVYNAARSILRRGQDGAIESLTRPRIRSEVASQAGQLHQLKRWISLNQGHEWFEDAKDLLSQIEVILSQPAVSTTNPSEAVSSEDMLSAIVARSSIPQEKQALLLKLLTNALALQTEPPRDSWRLQPLRRWSHEEVKEVHT